MSLDFQQVFNKIKEIAAREKDYQKNLKIRRAETIDLLNEYAGQLDQLYRKVELIVAHHDANLRSASPVTERLDTHLTNPEVSIRPVIIAVDGSQIVPSRHDAIFYGLVNAGAILLKPDADQAPEIFTKSELLFGEEARSKDGYLLSEGAIALKRDALERKMLLDLAKQADKPVVAFTDGPVELWGSKDPGNAGSYAKHLDEYLDNLVALQNSSVIFSGYVDKPGADLVIRLLEIAITPENELSEIRSRHPLRGVTDRWLFSKILGAGERSAIFSLQSSSRADYVDRSEKITTHFFYLNSGDEKYPAIARIEIPKWVAEDAAQIDLLQGTLLQQSQLLGVKPYPYLLHRAHEIAKVSQDERKQVEMILRLELSSAEIEFEDESNKQFTKNLPEQRKRYSQ